MRIPRGPTEPGSSTQDLLGWMIRQGERYGDVYRATIDGFEACVVSDADCAQHILRANWQNYVKGFAVKRVAFLMGNGLVVSEGALWQSQRRMIQPAFHRTVVAGLSGTIAAANRALLERWSAAARAGGRVNVTRDVSAMVLDLMLAILFGDDAEALKPEFRLLADEPVRDFKFAQAFRGLAKTVLRLITERRAREIEALDILGMLMAARDRDAGEPMRESVLVNEILTLIVAGHETTASVLNWTWYQLSRHREVEEALSRELDGLGADEVPAFDALPRFSCARQILEEVLRLYPQVWLLPRKALGEDRLGEYDVPAGMEILVSSYLIQRHPLLWPEPDRFDPGRFAPERAQGRHPLAMFPFSAGPRNCVGELLARVEMQMHVMMVAKRLRLRYDEERPPEMDAGVNLRSRRDFLMTPELK